MTTTEIVLSGMLFISMLFNDILWKALQDVQTERNEIYKALTDVRKALDEFIKIIKP